MWLIPSLDISFPDDAGIFQDYKARMHHTQIVQELIWKHKK